MERGKVYLVGAGPGDPELVTLKAIRCLQRADVVLYDRLVSPLLLTYAPPEAVCEYVGKEHGEDSCARQSAIIDRMIAEARLGKTVVRLKGGDPFVFGRGGEELLALAQAGISVEVVPGVSAAIAAPASAGIPVTFRGVARAFGVFTGHTEADEEVTDWQLAARVPTEVTLYRAVAGGERSSPRDTGRSGTERHTAGAAGILGHPPRSDRRRTLL